MEHTEASPVQVMCDPVLWLFRVRDHPFSNVLSLRLIARIPGSRSAIFYMKMSTHALAHQITHHGSSVVTRTKLMTIKLKDSAIRTINGPLCSSH